MKRKRKYYSYIVAIIIILLMIIGQATIIKRNTNITNNLQNNNGKTRAEYDSVENLRQSYEVATDEVIENTNNALTVDAWFLIDKNGKCVMEEKKDNEVEQEEITKRRGVYQKLEDGYQVKAYVKINISQEMASLKDTCIKVGDNNSNFNVESTLDADGTLVKSVENENRNIKFVDGAITTGTIVQIPLTLTQRVLGNGTDYRQYSKDNEVKFSGTYVQSNGNEVKFDKTINLSVDWDGDNQLDSVTIKNNITSKNQEGTKVDSFAIVGDELIASLTVTSQTAEKNEDGIANRGIPSTAEYKINGLKIGGYAPKEIVVASGLYNYSVKETIPSDYKYDSDNDELTFKNVMENPDRLSFWQTEHKSVITIKYPIEALNWAKDNKPITMSITATSKEMIYCNPKIRHEDTKSLLTGNGAQVETREVNGVNVEVGTKYTNEKKTTEDFTFNNFDGELYELEHEINYQSKANSLLYYAGATDTKAGFWEDYKITASVGGSIIKNLKLEKDYKDQKGFEYDAFYNDKDGKYTSMDELIKYEGVYLDESVIQKLGENGTVTFYDVDTGKKLKLKDDKNSNLENVVNNGTYYFDHSVKNIRAVTSSIVEAGTFQISYIIGIDNEKLVKNISQDKFEKFTKIVSSATLYMKTGKNYEKDGYTKTAVGPYTEGNLGFRTTNQESVKTVGSTQINDWEMKLETIDYSEQYNHRRITTFWNPSILIMFPENVTDVQVSEMKAYLESNPNEECRLTNRDYKKTIKVYTYKDGKK